MVALERTKNHDYLHSLDANTWKPKVVCPSPRLVKFFVMDQPSATYVSCVTVTLIEMMFNKLNSIAWSKWAVLWS